ncbi:uncharacterized protein LOC118741883 [Rhagoletis pomonella]|uniref:uncharacterized protein LOC118741883 n=1 Tax=Rhagoletis pomonella TaxID=28610 RepID=UPI00177BC19C|nr:uncharacterized protein LOC118741883 [Rhagoletis pomonella]
MSTFVVMAAEFNSPHISSDKPPRNCNSSSRLVKTALACWCCKDNHRLYQCLKFKDCNNDKRWEIVKTNRLCFCCLSQGHNVYNCPRRRACGVSLCQKSHNKLLHNEIAKNANTGNIVPAESAVATVSTCRSLVNDKKQSTNANKERANVNKTLLKFLPVKLHGPKGSMQIIAFIDDGAKVTLLEEEIANKIGLTGRRDLLHLKWFDDQTTSEVSMRANLEISSVNSNKRFDMKGVRTIKKLLLPPQTLCVEKFAHQFEELNDIPIENYSDAIPKILIGMPHTNLVRPLSVVNFNEGFTVHETKLGWTLFGSDENNFNNSTVCHVDINDQGMNEIQKQLDDYFALEGYDVALRRLKLVEQKMLRDSSYAEWYNAKINEYINKGYARKLSSTELPNERVWYLPHFAVYNVNKGNKPRLVFDAAAKINDVSLNSMLMKGPDDYQPRPLQSILFKFREGMIAVCGDIREMFHRINIIEEDQNFQRFLWRKGDTSRPPDVYIMKAMIFGSICSPCSAQFVKNLNALKFKHEDPRAVEAIINRHYVDDYVDSFPGVDESISVTKKVIEIHSKAGFELRGFISNSSELLRAIDCNTEYQGDSKNMCGSESAYEKVLGMHWKANCDVFFFNLVFARVPKSVLDGTRRPTKAELLGLTMSIFDPFGFLANVTLVPKILLQRLWKLNIGWHDAIPVDIYDKWYQWYTMLDNLSKLSIPRCYATAIFMPAILLEFPMIPASLET